ncbi:hypothetical protein RIF29_21337 [Crotalaria pallida]|uniref:Uncharacterized protein n=1 Tax=Crotalaria pallida TaxID=3830 RepID=A0AAN9F790_CROPI
MWECISTLRNLEVPCYKPERNKIICKSKEKEEAHLHKYVTIAAAIEADMYEYNHKAYTGLFDFDINRSFRIQEEAPFILFKEHIAEEFGIPVTYQRLWVPASHSYKREGYRPLTPEEETQAVGKFTVFERVILFLEWEKGQWWSHIPPQPSCIILAKPFERQ